MTLWVTLALGIAVTAGTAFAGIPPDQDSPPAVQASDAISLTTPTPVCELGFELIPGPNTGTENFLTAVSGIAPDDLWAVGTYNSPYMRPLTAHWNGSSWAAVPAPDVNAQLLDLATVSANDAWAVGYQEESTLIMHWDGIIWSLVPSPNPGPGYNFLSGVSAVSANDAWAVGYYQDAVGESHALTLHWNGIVWEVKPNPGTDGTLRAVTALSSNDVWAAGVQSGTPPVDLSTLMMHWDGSAWTIVPSPNLPGFNSIEAITATGPNDVWAVGYLNPPSTPAETLTMHWDGSTWTRIPSPNVTGATSIGLYSVTAAAPNDVWAVGSSSQSTDRTLVEHWDGSEWSIVTSPNASTGRNALFGVTALPNGNVWTVGQCESTVNTYHSLVERYGECLPTVTPTFTRTPTRTPTYGPSATPSNTPTPGCQPGFIMMPAQGAGIVYGVDGLSSNDLWVVGASSVPFTRHWNGTGWSTIPVPINNGTLQDIEVITAEDAWAVGYYSGVGVILRWNGSEWSRMTLPPDAGSGLYDLEAVSAEDIWAVGYAEGLPSPMETRILHWDGDGWSVIPSPNVGTSYNYLGGITAISSSDIWAVGYYSSDNGMTVNTLILHWDGSAWSVVTSPNVLGSYMNVLLSVSAAASNDVWAVGYHGQYNMLIAHWNGTAWSIVSGPDLSGQWSKLQSVDATRTDGVWMAGSYGVSGTLVLNWSGAVWTIVPTAIPLPSYNGLQDLKTLDDGTLWAVGNTTDVSGNEALVVRYNGCPPCSIRFIDVQPTDYFYEPVRYLYCQGAISGYPDNTFRPYNNTTRSQLTKIIVLAEHWPIVTPSGTPTFSDVPADNAFYQYVETAVNHQIISGYSDGTFRPYNNVTRGQLSKMVVLAEEWTLLNPPTATFIDVPTTHTFYRYVETAYAHSLISGYSCGSGCLEFRPGNNATRGQISKIMYLAVTGP